MIKFFFYKFKINNTYYNLPTPFEVTFNDNFNSLSLLTLFLGLLTCKSIFSKLSDNELFKLNQKSKWDEEKGEWTIPLFTLNAKSREIAFPTINAKQRVE